MNNGILYELSKEVGINGCIQRQRIAEVPELEFLSLGRSDKVK
jgi:hypothetical protein